MPVITVLPYDVFFAQSGLDLRKAYTQSDVLPFVLKNRALSILSMQELTWIQVHTIKVVEVRGEWRKSSILVVSTEEKAGGGSRWSGFFFVVVFLGILTFLC